ncbi:MAG: hypothetical protein R6U28_11460 [Cyclonatronaceae bacterium]
MKHHFSKIRTTLPVVLLLCSALQAFVPQPAAAQETQTLLSGDVSHGGFGGPVVRFGRVDGDMAVWVGGRGGWIINFSNRHSLSIGGGGYGLATEHRMPQPVQTDVEELAAIGYGGFELEYTNRTYRLIHMTASTLIGAGGLAIRENEQLYTDDDPSAFFVLEPGVHAELNVTGFFRLAGGVSYRLTSGIDKGGFSDGDFSGINALVTLKFGSF